MEFTKVGTMQLSLIVLGVVIFLVVPLIVAIVWVKKKNEKVSSVITGAAAFLLFALVLEKPIQNILVFPEAMGLSAHAASRFLNARPVLWALVLGLFPGVFEETGRLVAFKSVLKNRKNRETSISYGIGHGGFEAMLVLGGNFITYLVFAAMINAGTFGGLVAQIAQKNPAQEEAGYQVAAMIAAFSVKELLAAVIGRIFAILYHTGASILVFYACKDPKKLWLYPLAILLHTAIDGVMGLQMAGVLSLSSEMTEMIALLPAGLIFFAAYFLLYRKDGEKGQA
ncbi:MAG: YhfC family intramembrane metalloprotease [Lachnospiraceae bacterium]|nr:YhfC family intramembrane metalloprotease [Lachnospiraceae bacterium]